MLIIGVVGLSVVCAGQGEQPPKDQLRYESMAAARVNPMGLYEQLDVFWRHQLFDSDHPLLEGSHLDVGVTSLLTPAYARVGPRIRVEPAAVLRLTAAYEFFTYFGNLNQIQSYATTRANYSDSAIRTSPHEGGTGRLFTLEGRLQAKLGRVAARTTGTLFRFDARLPDGDITYYDQMTDTLAPNHGHVVRLDNDLLYLSDAGLTAGLRWSWTDAAHGDGSQADAPTQRLGPVVVLSLSRKDSGVFADPTVIAMANWWLRHPYRTGRDGSQAVPMIALALAFNGGLT